ncbi:hypothetical protein FXN61_48830, partial [Lentzea sp. PSKA42]|nr:hypothetical protein [Lentzea indica]
MQNEARKSEQGAREDDQNNGDRLMLHIASAREIPASHQRRSASSRRAASATTRLNRYHSKIS